MKTVVSTKGQVVLPAEIRKRDRIEPGQEFEIVRIGKGRYRLSRSVPRTNKGLVELLLSCPAKGWFKRAERAETTDDVEALDLG